MNYTLYQYSDSDLVRIVNQAKEQIIFALADEGLLKGDPDEIAGNYVVMLHKKGYLGRLWDRWRGVKSTDEEGSLIFSVMKYVSCGIPGGEEESEPKLKVVPMPTKKKKD